MKFNFTKDEIENFTEQSFEPIPEGIYNVKIEDIEEKTTKNGGLMLSIKERITRGQYANRVIFQNVNIKNSNEIAEKIGRNTMFNIYIAAGVDFEKDTKHLLNKIFSVKVIQQTYNEKITNVVKSVVLNSKEMPTPATETKVEPEINENELHF